MQIKHKRNKTYNFKYRNNKNKRKTRKSRKTLIQEILQKISTCILKSKYFTFLSNINKQRGK